MPPEPRLATPAQAAGARFDPRSLLFWPALPVIAAQGLWLRRRAYRAPPAAGAPHGVVGEGPPLRLLALGDSIIAGVGIAQIGDAVPAAFARALAARWRRQVAWTACGVNGADVHTARLLLRRARRQQAAPDVVLISLGVNDATGLHLRRRFAAGLSALYAELRAFAPQALLLHSGIPPLQRFPLLPSPLNHLLGLRAAQLDAVIARVIAGFAPALHLPFTEMPRPEQFAADGFHPAAEACALWSERLVARLPAADQPKDAG